MKKTILIGLFALFTSGIFAQTGGYDPTLRNGSIREVADIYMRTVDLNEKSLSFGLTEAEFEKIKDEAYENINFITGNIYQEDQLIKSGIPMRFNAYADEIEIKQRPSEKEYNALVKDASIFVKMGTEIYVLIPYKGSNEKGGYFNVLYDGNTYDLYKKTKATFKEGVKAKSTYGRDTPPSFSKATTYYLVDDGRFLEIPNTSSRILKMMDSKGSEMKAFIKKNKLDLNKEQDLINAITHFDSLL